MSWLPRFCARNRPDQTQRRIVSAVRPATRAAALTSNSSAGDVFMPRFYYTMATTWSRSSPHQISVVWQTHRQLTPNRPCDSGRSHLDESGRVEVAIEGKGLTDPSPPHYCEACRVHKRVLALGPRPQPAPRCSLGRVVDMYHFYVRKGSQAVEESNRCRMSRSAAEQRPGLANHLIGRDDPADAPGHKSSGLFVAPVAPLLQTEPEAGVGEPHRSRS